MGRVQDTVNSIKSTLKSVISPSPVADAGLETSLEREIARCRSEFEAAKAAHDVSTAAADRADSDLLKAKKAFEADPANDSLAMTFFRCEKLIAVAAEKVQTTQGPLDRSRNALATAEASLASKVDQEALASKIADLRRRGSLEGFRTRNGLSYAVILNSFDDIRKHAQSIETDFANTNEAAQELAELTGEATEQIEMHHQVLPLLELFVDQNRDQLAPVVLALSRGYDSGVLNYFGHGISEALCQPIDRIKQPGFTSEADVPYLLEKLEVLASHPSLHDGMVRAQAMRPPTSVDEVLRFEKWDAERAERKAARTPRTPAEGVLVEAPELGAKYV